MKKVKFMIAVVMAVLCICACSGKAKIEGTVTVAVDGALQKNFEDSLIPLFTEKYPDVTLKCIYGSSSELKKKIENEEESVDVFLSVTESDMNYLKEKSLLDDSLTTPFLKNRIVLIASADNTLGFTEFADIVNANTIAIANPERIQVGKDAETTLVNINAWDQIKSKTSFATSGAEVLNWVALGKADVGIVYLTTAMGASDRVSVIAKASAKDDLENVIPVGIVKNTQNRDAAKEFIKFLKSHNVIKIFTDEGFIAIN